MVGKINEILKITNEQDFVNAQAQFDNDLEEAIEVLQNLLDKNVLSTDVTDIQKHMTLVESFRARVCKWHALAVGFSEYGSSIAFMPPKEKGKVSDEDRKAHVRCVAAASKAQVAWLDGLIRSIDSRTNLCKKLLGIEGDGANYGRNTVCG